MIRYRYVIYGLGIESELCLPSADEDHDAASKEPAIRIFLGLPAQFRAIGLTHTFDPADWVFHAILPDGGIYIKAENVFEAVISRNGREVSCRTFGNIDPRSVEANLVNFVVSASLTLQGEEPLHATAVDLDGHALGLLGLSGSGKSSLAALLINRGADLITDDMLRVKFEDDKVVAYPGPYRLKLFDDPLQRFLPGATEHGHFNPLSGKIMIQPRSTIPEHRTPLPLVALFHLGEPGQVPPGGAISMSRMKGVELTLALISSTMDDRYVAPDRLARQMAFVARLLDSLPVYALRYPRRFDVMDQVADMIRRTVRP